MEQEEDKFLDLLLFEFLHKCKAQRNFHVYHSIVNREFTMSSVLEQHRDFLSEHWDTFKQLTEEGRFVEGEKVFVHINHFASVNRLRYHVNRRFDSLPEEYKFNCNLHTRKCRVLEETLAFLMYIV